MSESCLLELPPLLECFLFFNTFEYIRNFIKKVRTDFWKLLESFNTKELRKSKLVANRQCWCSLGSKSLAGNRNMPWPREKESANSAPPIRPQHSQHMATHNHPSNRRSSSSSSSNSHNNNNCNQQRERQQAEATKQQQKQQQE